MALARALSIGLVGVEGHLVELEVDISAGLPGFRLVGLPDTALHEARDRVRAAIVNSGEEWPKTKVTVALSPAMLPKRGSTFDLAMAAAVLAAAGRLPDGALAGVVLVGELGLDGRVRPARGVLPATVAALAAGVQQIIVPASNVAEAALVPDVVVSGVASLTALLRLLRGEPPLDEPVEQGQQLSTPVGPGADLVEVIGAHVGRRALEVAAAGGHHLFLLGPPGAGKTMLAERLPGILPPLEPRAALEASAVHSVAGTLPAGSPLLRWAPYRDPHHSATIPALVGGGSPVARPGEISLAHRGVLFLDEAPEFRAGALDALRQPMETGRIAIARAGGTARFPARFCLVLAANPCPCAPTTGRELACTCSALTRRRYLGRLSGPLLDRVDLQVQLWPISRADLLVEPGGTECSETVRGRVCAARDRCASRLHGTPWQTNAEVPGWALRSQFRAAPGALVLAERALERGQLSARGIDRVLRVAWTLSDLAEHPRPGADEVADALGLRLPGLVAA